MFTTHTRHPRFATGNGAAKRLDLADVAAALALIESVVEPIDAILRDVLFQTNEDTPVLINNVTLNDIDIDGTIDAGSVDLDPLANGKQTIVSTIMPLHS